MTSTVDGPVRGSGDPKAPRCGSSPAAADPVYIVINRSWGEVDWILPVAAYLKERGFYVVAIFVHHHVYEMGRRAFSGFLDLLRRSTHEIHHPGGFVARLPLRDRLAHMRGAYRKSLVDGRRGFSRIGHSLIPVLAPTAGNLRHFKRGRLSRYICDRYMQVGFRKGTVFVDDTLLYDASKKDGGYYDLIDHLKKEMVIIYPHYTMMETESGRVTSQLEEGWRRFNNLQVTCTKIFLSSVDPAAGAFPAAGREQAVYSGTPRYQGWWTTQLRRTAEAERKGSSDGAKPTVMLLTRYNPKIYATLEKVFDGILRVLTENHCQILLKPHPRTPRDVLSDFRRKLGRRTFRLIEEPIMLSALYADVVITLPGTGIADAVAAGAPVLEFYDRARIDTLGGAAWYVNESGPEKQMAASSIYGQLGLVQTVTSLEELDSVIKQIKAGEIDLAEKSREQRRALDKVFNTELHAGEIIRRAIETVPAGTANG